MHIIKKLIDATYPLRMLFSKNTGLGIQVLDNKKGTAAPISFYSLSATSGSKKIDFEAYRGKYVLLVNVASQCGFTPQYTELQELQDKYKEKLIILGFPANDFAGQEPGSDDTIANFCKVNFGVTFPLFLKAPVTGKLKQPVYTWLTQVSNNGWNSKSPSWNFCKYLVDPSGTLLAFFSSSVSPLAADIISRIR